MIRDIVLKPDNFNAFRKLIPTEYQKEFLNDELAGFGYYESEADANLPAVAGVILTRRFGRWLEIEWIALSDYYNTSATAMQMINLFAYRAFLSPLDYLGCYISVYPGEEETLGMLEESGFKFSETEDGIYEFTIDMVDRNRIAGGEEFEDCCKSIRDAEPELLSEVEKQLMEDERPLPISFPLKTEDYDADMSLVYKDDKSSGIILASVSNDHIMINAMVSQSVFCASAMLRLFLLSFDNLYGKDVTISIPVISEETEKMIRRIVPAAKSGIAKVGCLRF